MAWDNREFGISDFVDMVAMCCNHERELSSFDQCRCAIDVSV